MLSDLIRSKTRPCLANWLWEPIGYFSCDTWWRHQMETFSALLAICVGNSPVAGEFPVQRPVTRSFDVFFDLRLNKRLSKQWWGWWFETLSRPLWRHCNEILLEAWSSWEIRCTETLTHRYSDTYYLGSVLKLLGVGRCNYKYCFLKDNH